MVALFLAAGANVSKGWGGEDTALGSLWTQELMQHIPSEQLEAYTVLQQKARPQDIQASGKGLACHGLGMEIATSSTDMGCLL